MCDHENREAAMRTERGYPEPEVFTLHAVSGSVWAYAEGRHQDAWVIVDDDEDGEIPFSDPRTFAGNLPRFAGFDAWTRAAVV